MSPMPTANWQPHLSLGITGHRETNVEFAANTAAVTAALSDLLDQIDEVLVDISANLEGVRLHSLLVDGVDQIAGELALARGWNLVAPLPFGADLNLAINSRPETPADAAALCAGKPAGDVEVEARAQKIRLVTAKARLFELADRDEEVKTLFEDALANPGDHKAVRAFEALCSDQVTLAGRVMIERTDLIIAVWDGKAGNLPGGTGHTVVTSLERGTPVLIMNPRAPRQWSIHTRPEELGHLTVPDNAGSPVAEPDTARLRASIEAAIAIGGESMLAIERETWRDKSSRGFSFYRRIEAVFGKGRNAFGKLSVTYEAPEAISTGSAAPLLETAKSALPGDDRIVDRLSSTILPAFAWADGVSSRLSDAYRSGMCFNFLLAALAVIIGIAYLPLGLSNFKWTFALMELLLLAAILTITFLGYRRAWHRRWFEMRRVAEYLRHAPSLLMLGVFRPTGRWPRGQEMEWPENYARHSLREVGLPQIKLDRDYLRSILRQVVSEHVESQRTYHEAKAARLATVHRRLDKAAETCFFLAIISVSLYLGLKLGSVVGILPPHWPDASAKLLTFFGVAFPTLAANLSGIRYFGDFERFAAISRVTAEKLDEIRIRIDLLLTGSEHALTYAAASELVRALDETVVGEIESWQAVFGAKHLALPA